MDATSWGIPLQIRGLLRSSRHIVLRTNPCQEVDKLWIAPARCGSSTWGLPRLSRGCFLWMDLLTVGAPGRAQERRRLGTLRKFWCFPQMPGTDPRSAFHLHLISDATGETLTTMAKVSPVASEMRCR